MTRNKTLPHIKLAERNHVGKPLLDQFDGAGHNHPHARSAHRQEARHRLLNDTEVASYEPGQKPTRRG